MPLPQRCYLSLSLGLIQLLTTEIKDESCCAFLMKRKSAGKAAENDALSIL